MLTPYGYVTDKIIKRIFQDHWDEFLCKYKDKIPEEMQSSVIDSVNKMLQCGTKEIGYAIYMCTNCHEHPEKIVFFIMLSLNKKASDLFLTLFQLSLFGLYFRPH